MACLTHLKRTVDECLLCSPCTSATVTSSISEAPHHPKKNPYTRQQALPVFPQPVFQSPGQQTSQLSVDICLFWTFPKHGLTQRVGFCVWLPSLRITFPRSIRILVPV